MLPARGEFTKLGKGSILADMYVNGAPTGEMYFMGNANSVTIGSTSDFAELYSSTERSAALIARTRTRLGYTMGISLNEYTIENLQRFFIGDMTAGSQSSSTGATKAILGAKKGKYYDLGYRRVTNVTGVNVTASNAALSASTDFYVSSDGGIVQILPGASITDGDNVTFTFNRPALTMTKVAAAKGASQTAKIIYQADDANTDSKVSKDRVIFWRVDLSPDGDMNLISDDYGAFGLSGSILSDATNHPDSPYLYIERVN